MGRSARSSAQRVTIVCGFTGCQKTQTLRQSRLNVCDGYYCRWDHAPDDSPTPGLARETVGNAAGSFTGWREVPIDDELHASLSRARRIALFGAASTIPEHTVIATLQALAGPAGRPSRSILTIGELSTGVDVDNDGQVDIELPNVAAALCLMLTRGDTSGVILRTFTDQVSGITPTGCPIPVKHVRGWLMHGGALEPLPTAEIHSSYSIDADTLEPITPDPDLEFHDAWPVALPELPAP